MILLEKAKENPIVVTLKELQTLENPYFLFVFREVDSQTNTAVSNYAVILSDLSSFTYRYNEFTLTLPTELDIPDLGDYQYWVFEQVSDSNLVPPTDMETGLLETGIMRMNGDVNTNVFPT